MANAALEDPFGGEVRRGTACHENANANRVTWMEAS